MDQELVSSQIQDLLKKIYMHTRHAMVKQFEKEEITFHQYYILKTIDSNPNINFTELGEKLNLAKSSVSLIINKLVDEGYVNRIEDPKDRRYKYLVLTELGKETITKCKEMSRNTFSTLIDSIQHDELINIRNNLQLLFDSMNEKMKHDNRYGGCKHEKK